jgi:hypothetical protein
MKIRESEVTRGEQGTVAAKRGSTSSTELQPTLSLHRKSKHKLKCANMFLSANFF